LKVAIFNHKDELSLKATRRCRELLAQYGIEEDDFHPNIVISIGGDGTLLSAFHQYESQLEEVQFVAVHTGHLGFYTDWRDFEMEELIQSLLLEQKESVSYPLLQVTVTYRGEEEESETFLALNESTIRRHSRTLVGDIYIKDELFESFRGDGISVSTPTGSTAYNKSVGGAVIHPSINALQMAEVASLNNRVFRTLGSPIVIGPNEWIRVVLEEADDYLITIDRDNLTFSSVQSIQFCIAKKRIRFLSYRHTYFWNRVKDAFIQGTNEQ